MDTLKEIYTKQTAKNFRTTDKNRGGRQHLGLYSVLFDEYRESATKMFEIGVNKGGSIRPAPGCPGGHRGHLPGQKRSPRSGQGAGLGR